MQTMGGFDHVALTTTDIDDFCAFYDGLFGARTVLERSDEAGVSVRQIVLGGRVKLSVHRHGNGHRLVAARPTPGSADFCIAWLGSIASAIDLLRRKDVPMIDGPVRRDAWDGREATSIYFRDLDGNLVELMSLEGEV